MKQPHPGTAPELSSTKTRTYQSQAAISARKGSVSQKSRGSDWLAEYTSLQEMAEKLGLALVLADGTDRVGFLSRAAMRLVELANVPDATHESVWDVVRSLAYLAQDGDEAAECLTRTVRTGKAQGCAEAQLIAAQGAGSALRVWVFTLDYGREEADERTRYALVIEQSEAQRDAGETDHAFVRSGSGYLQRQAELIEASVKDLLGRWRKLDSGKQGTALRAIAGAVHDLRTALAVVAELDELRRNGAVLHIEPVEPGDVLMALLADWKTRAAEHSFELALPGEVPSIMADMKRVQQCLNLLLEAAVWLSPEGGTVRVDVRPRRDDVVVSVRQFGRAAPESDLGEIFELFYAPPTGSGESVGGGLGLALAREIVERHGGRVWAEMPPSGPGMVLFAAWPFVPNVVSVGAVAPDSVAMMTGEGAVVSTRPVAVRERPVALVLDSDPRMVRYLRANLDAQQYRPIVAGDPDEAFHLVDVEEPDVVLLDAESFGMSSAELVGKFRAYTEAPIVVLTRRYDADECVSLLDLGAADYVAKPFHLDELFARVRAAVRTQASHQHAVVESVFQTGDLLIDFAQRAVVVDGRNVSLSKTEFKVLRELARHAGMVLSHETLLERVWGPAYREEIEFVWVYMRRLRRKIEPDPSVPRYILTAPGVGYRLVRM